MLLREFTVDHHNINLTQDGSLYIITVKNQSGEKVFYHEYNCYDKIKFCFDEIIQRIDNNEFTIKDVISVLEQSTI